MNKIDVISGEETLNGEIVRYIKYNKYNYVIYTLNEKDDEGYEKLYINKIVDNEEDLIVDADWTELKKNIPTIVKQIKNNDIKDFVDLNVNDIKKVNSKYSKAFKLKINIVDSIKKEEVNINTELNSLLDELNKQEESISNLDSFLDQMSVEKIEKPVNPDNKLNIEIEKLKEELAKEKQGKTELENRIKKMEIINKKYQVELKKYKEKLAKIKIMIEQS